MMKLAHTYHDNKALSSNQSFSRYSSRLVYPTYYFLFSRLKKNSEEVDKNYLFCISIWRNNLELGFIQ